MAPTRNPMRWREAGRAIRALIADPDDTSQVFRIIRALSGRAGDRAFERFRRSEGGRRLLAGIAAPHHAGPNGAMIDAVSTPPPGGSLLAILSDRAGLERLPAGSLGRAYAEFTRVERITPQGLVDASLAVPDDAGATPERRLFAARLRDGHDLWHVVTGFGRDLIGEAALLAFTWRQTGNPGIGLIVAVAWWRAGRALPGARRLIVEGYRRGGRAVWLPAVEWEALLERPLDEVRRTLAITPIEAYTPVRSASAPRLA